MMSAPGMNKHQKVNNNINSTPTRAAKGGGVTDEDAEREHFQRILHAFRCYRSYSLQRITKTENYLSSLPSHHQVLLKSYKEHLSDLKNCTDKNSEIIRLITRDVAHMFENVKHSDDPSKPSMKPNLSDMEKVQVTLKQFVRDWSSEGAEERNSCYQPIIDEIVRQFPEEKNGNLSEICVLVPGAGLGRLAYEIAKRGYSCQGNEFSLFMLFASNFVLNKCKGLNSFEIYPWVHSVVNNISHSDQIKPARFPDADPSDLPPDSRFSMAAGDFLEVYTDANTWDCVSTCFFIDCANNIVAFLETIFNILKPGGVWINLGPLLYHFADIPGEDSIEPSYEILRQIVVGIGFVIEKDVINMPTTYAQNPNSMFQYQYKSGFLVCRKPVSTGLNHVEHAV